MPIVILHQNPMVFMDVGGPSNLAAFPAPLERYSSPKGGKITSAYRPRIGLASVTVSLARPSMVG